MGEPRPSVDVTIIYPAMATELAGQFRQPVEEALREARTAADVVKMLLDYPADEAVWTDDRLFAVLVEELGKLNKAVRDYWTSLTGYPHLQRS